MGHPGFLPDFEAQFTYAGYDCHLAGTEKVILYAALQSKGSGYSIFSWQFSLQQSFSRWFSLQQFS
jgi:hypothetical protein